MACENTYQNLQGIGTSYSMNSVADGVLVAVWDRTATRPPPPCKSPRSELEASLRIPLSAAHMLASRRRPAGVNRARCEVPYILVGGEGETTAGRGERKENKGRSQAGAAHLKFRRPEQREIA
jgi:hypothetical protein